MRSSFLLSLVVHSVLFALMFGAVPGCGGGGKGKGDKDQREAKSESQQKEDKQKIAEKLKEREPIQIEIVESDDIGKPKPEKKKMVDRDCGKLQWFGGIGLEMTYDFDAGTYSQRLVVRVGKLPKGYPAERSGIKVGDEILNQPEIRGTPGTDAIVKVRRNGEEMTFIVVREKICLEPIPGGQP